MSFAIRERVSARTRGSVSSHSSLTDIGVTSHVEIDSHIGDLEIHQSLDQVLNTLAIPSFNGITLTANEVTVQTLIGDSSAISYRGRDDSGSPVVYSSIEAIALVDFTSTDLRSNLELSICASNESTKSVFVDIRDTGLTIGRLMTSYTLPMTRGLTDQTLSIDGIGDVSWVTPFIPYHYSYQTDITSATYFTSPTIEIIETPGNELTSLIVEETGTYQLEFIADVTLAGNLPQQLTAKVDSIITELESLTFQNFAAAEWGGNVLTAGNYSHTGAMSITGTLELSGSSTDVFVLRVIGALTAVAGSQVLLSNGALSQNVYWIVEGILGISANAFFTGVSFGKAGITLAANASVNGRLYSQKKAAASPITFATNSNIIILPPDTGTLLSLGVLSDYMIYNSFGDISRSSPPLTNLSNILTGQGTISGFGGGYDGTFNSGVIQPIIYIDFIIHKNGIAIQLSNRCIKKEISECNLISIKSDIACIAGDEIDARLRVNLLDTACIVNNRYLSLNRVVV
jgi:hypothetical protein